MIERCQECGKKLNPKNTVWLELSIKTGKYYISLKSDPMPESESQGAFPFGKDCAAKVVNVYKSDTKEIAA